MTHLILGMVLLSVCASTMAVFPFGIEHGDRHIPADGGDGSDFIEYLFELDVGGEHYEKVEVHSSGYMDLLSGTQPRQSDSRIVVWKKMAPGNPTDLYARLASDEDIGAIVATFPETTFTPSFEANRMLIATWVNEDDTVREDVPVNQFQCVILSDGYESHVIFLDNDDCRDSDPITEGQDPCTEPVSVQLNPLVKEPISSVAYSYFQLKYNGRCLRLRSSYGVLENCKTSSGNLYSYTRYRISGSQLRLYDSSSCLDREACHSSTSEVRYSDCSHCGALHWQLWSSGKLTEDDANNCIYYAGSWNAHIHHTQDGCIYFDSYWVSSAFSHQEFPQPDVHRFMENVPVTDLKGLRLYRDQQHKTARFEVVHSIPTDMQFSVTADNGVYQVEYWVTDVQTSVPYEDTLVAGMIIDWLKSRSDVVASVGLRYGAVDFASKEFGEIDGVLSIFVMNDDPTLAEVQFNSESLLSLFVGVHENDWWLTNPHFHSGEHMQTYYTFLEESPNYPGLYWAREYEE